MRLVDVLGSPERFVRLKTRGIALKLRQANLERIPYSVIFYSNREFTVVVAVAHYKRRPNYWCRRLKN